MSRALFVSGDYVVMNLPAAASRIQDSTQRIVMRISWSVLLAASALFLAIACGGDDDDDEGRDTVERLGDQPVNDHGTEAVSGKSEIEFGADDFYFEPTFLRGTAGQKLILKVHNEGNARHNVSISALNLDRDVDVGQEIEVEVTFPQSSVALFFCKYHQAQGMVGELLVGDAQPAAAPVASGTTPAAGASGSDPYGY